MIFITQISKLWLSIKNIEELRSLGRIKMTTQKKVFTSFDGFIISAKPCLNLCSFRWLKLSLKCARSFSPFLCGSYTKIKKFPCFLVTINFLKILIDLVVVTSTLRLFHTLYSKGKTTLSDFVLVEMGLILEAFADIKG